MIVNMAILWRTLGPQVGVPLQGFPDYWRAPGAWSHLHVPGVTGSGKVSVGVCLKSILQVTPFNAGELKV